MHRFWYDRNIMATGGPDERTYRRSVDDMCFFDKYGSCGRRQTDTSSVTEMETLVMTLVQGIDCGNCGRAAMVSHPGGM